MADNSAMKRALIMQSFAPLFLILLIKYFDIKLFGLCERFGKIILKNPILALSKAVSHSIFVTLLLEFFCLLWIIYSVYSIRSFAKSQWANFVSEGESLIDIEKISDSGVTFFMTYVLPMTMEDWSKRLDLFLMADDREVLQDTGKITAEIAKAKAETEFEKYRVIQDRLFMSDFDKYMLELEENAKK